MIDADIRGKLRRDDGSAHDRSEDLLTSTVFGLLRYLSVEEVMSPLMESVRQAEVLLGQQRSGGQAEWDRPWIDVKGAATCEITFWPSFGEWGQPDILLTFRDSMRNIVHLVVVEAKLYSPKSGQAADDDDGNDQEDGEMPWHPDQLVRYWRGLLLHSDFQSHSRSSVVYLTAHAAPPINDLTVSLTACPTMRLGWISWRHIWDVVSPLARRNPASLAARDLERLLAHRGFKALSAFQMPASSLKGDGRFWIPKPWFGKLPSLSLRSGHSFWETR